VQIDPALSPDLRRRFKTGRPCLDLVHTGGEGELAAWEIADTPELLASLLPTLLRASGATFPTTEADLKAFRELRASICRAAFAAAEGAAPAATDVDVINAHGAGRPVVKAIVGGKAVLSDPTAAQAVATLAADAVDLFGGPLAHRIRVCAASDCGLLFVDASRPGRRRWCSMQRCGNLAKVRQHRARAD
jgi:predicted RNA-binding Zn ribbon-like protein